MERNYIEAIGISKSFSGVSVLKEVDFSVRRGEVHALCGENGAGKSTLIKILTGIYKKDSGSIVIDGAETELLSARQALDMGIVCIYQELYTVPGLDLAHNLFLGDMPRNRFGLVDRRKMYAEAEKILKRIGLSLPVRTHAGKLSIAQQQMLQIGWALARRAKLIIMDEPTSALTDKEAKMLFGLIRQMKDSGVSIVYISHKLPEILEISDRVTILRDGAVAATVEKDELTRETLVARMLGRPQDELYHKMHVKPREVALSLEALSKKGRFENISFSVRHGEVVGLLGPVSSGRSSIAETVFGLAGADSGRVLVDGEPVSISRPQDAMDLGIALVPEDRQLNGLGMLMSVLSNMTVAKLNSINNYGIINNTQKETLARQYIHSIKIKTPSMDSPVYRLSGGNQQKVVLSKWLMTDPRILILDEPTRGIDLEARAEIYAIISELASRGTAVLIISTEIQEIIGTCDRVLTIVQGRISNDFRVKDITRDDLLRAIEGGV